LFIISVISRLTGLDAVILCTRSWTRGAYSYPNTLPSVALPIFRADADFLPKPGNDVVECFGAGNYVKGSW